MLTWDLAQDLFREIVPPLTSGPVPSPGETYTVAAGQGSHARPRDLSDRGLLQSFCHRTTTGSLLWYVDEESPDNTLRPALGTLKYDLRWSHDQVPATEGPVLVRGQRVHDQSTPIDVSKLGKAIALNGRCRTLSDVRAAYPPTDHPT